MTETIRCPFLRNSAAHCTRSERPPMNTPLTLLDAIAVLQERALNSPAPWRSGDRPSPGLRRPSDRLDDMISLDCLLRATARAPHGRPPLRLPPCTPYQFERQAPLR